VSNSSQILNFDREDISFKIGFIMIDVN